MATSLVSTGVQFPDNSIQTTAAAAGGTVTATASGAITAGTGVIINSNGTVSVPTLTISTTTGPSATISSDSTQGDADIVWHSGINAYVAVWIQNSTNYLMGSVGVPASDGSVTWSTQQVLYNASIYSPAAVYYPTEGKVLVTFIIASGAILSGAVITATTSSLSASVTGSGQNTSGTYGSLAYDATAGVAVAVYSASGTGDPFARTVTVSGTGILWGAAANFPGGNELNTFYFPAAGKCVLFTRYSSNYLYAFLITVSGTSISIGTAQLLSTAEPGQRMSFAYSPVAGKAVIGYRDIPAYADIRTSVLSISGTTLSLGALTQITSADQGAYSSMVYDSYVDKVVLFYVVGGVTTLATRTGTISGTSISWGSETIVFSGTISDSSFVAAYDPVNARSGVIWAVPGGPTTRYAKTVSAGSSTLTSNNFLGISQSTVAGGASATITVVSGVNSNQSGLTPATKYYVGGNGVLTSTANAVFAGLALSATSILVKG